MSDQRPHLRVVRGDPTPEELAALVAVLAVRARAAAGSGAAGDRGPLPTATAGWPDRRTLLGAPLRPGPGAWRAALR